MDSTIETTFTLFILEKPALVKEIDKNFKYKSIEAFNGKCNWFYGFLF